MVQGSILGIQRTLSSSKELAFTNSTLLETVDARHTHTRNQSTELQGRSGHLLTSCSEQFSQQLGFTSFPLNSKDSVGVPMFHQKSTDASNALRKWPLLPNSRQACCRAVDGAAPAPAGALATATLPGHYC